MSAPLLGPARSEDAIANSLWAVRIRFPLRAIVLLEGDDDERLFARHFNLTTCQIRVAYGRPRVLAVLDRLHARGVAGVLAIIDADFDRLLGQQQTAVDIVVTDTHDIETMLFQSVALDHVLRELADTNRLGQGAQGVRELILNAAAPLGAARLVCRKQDWSPLLEEIEHRRFVDIRSLLVDRDALIKEIRARQAKTPPQKRVGIDMEARVDAELASGHSLWDLCQGHDVASIFALALRAAIGSRKDELSGEIIERCLRLAFDAAAFCSTALRVAITAWEVANPGYKVLL
jgi:hypothetical protein